MEAFEKRMTVETHPVKQIRNPADPNQMVTVQELDFDVISEPWAKIVLKDGGFVRFRSTITKVFRVLDPDTKQVLVDTLGEPQLLILHAEQMQPSV